MSLLPERLRTTVIGSYAWPTWFNYAVEAIKNGTFGHEDRKETLDDAVDLALRDQEEAGVDLVTDGEMRRLGFFTADFYGRLTGLEPLPAVRNWGPGGHDQRERYEAVERIDAPDGLGLVAEYTYAVNRTRTPLKVPCPGPFTLAGRLVPGSLYPDRMDAAARFAELINAELKKLTAAGLQYIQLDEPSYAVHKYDPDGFVDLFNRTVDGVNADISVHLCFGNYLGRPVAHRTYRPLFPHLTRFNADEIALEFANRELAELDLIRKVTDAGKRIAIGVVDVKNYFIETPEIVADRIRQALRFAPADQVVITPDCGFSQTARWAARAKLQALVAGARLVRQNG